MFISISEVKKVMRSPRFPIFTESAFTYTIVENWNAFQVYEKKNIY